MFLKLHDSQFLKSKLDISTLQNSQEYIEAAIQNLHGNYKKEVSFLSGNVGVHAIALGVYSQLGNSNEIEKHTKAFKQGFEMAQDAEFAKGGLDELFNGRAGILSGAYWIKDYLSIDVISEMDLLEMCKQIVDTGDKYSKQHGLLIPLMYEYHEKEYLGAAHGISSILQIILALTHHAEEQINIPREYLRVIKDTLDKILDLQSKDGNFPTKYGGKESELIHWCHGAPGVFYLFAKAYIVFQEEKYLNACLKCGDLIWHKGLLRKGPGICHGVAGNGYVFLILYRLTKDPKHLYRATKFMEFLTNEMFVKEARIPDRPFSLYEGLAGTVCFLVDLLEPEMAAFPFSNVFGRK